MQRGAVAPIIRSMDAFQSLVGRLLVAMPGIGDARFEHAVILVCVHEPDHAMGLRLDLPAPAVDLKSVLAKLEIPAPDTAIGRPVMDGGPVDRERGFVLHTDDWMIADASMPIAQHQHGPARARPWPPWSTPPPARAGPC